MAWLNAPVVKRSRTATGVSEILDRFGKVRSVPSWLVSGGCVTTTIEGITWRASLAVVVFEIWVGLGLVCFVSRFRLVLLPVRFSLLFWVCCSGTDGTALLGLCWLLGLASSFFS